MSSVFNSNRLTESNVQTKYCCIMARPLKQGDVTHEFRHSVTSYMQCHRKTLTYSLTWRQLEYDTCNAKHRPPKPLTRQKPVNEVMWHVNRTGAGSQRLLPVGTRALLSVAGLSHSWGAASSNTPTSTSRSLQPQSTLAAELLTTEPPLSQPSKLY